MRDKKKQVLWRSLKIFAASFITVAIIGLLVFVTQGRDIPVLNPQGFIANQQYSLIMITVILGIFVVVPVFILLFSIAWKYRIGNKKAKYNPELEGNRNLEILWWSIPCLIILVLAIITYFSTHALDPYKQLDSQKTPVEVQVVALKWNWLFIYPEYGTATLNYMNIPADTPINLTLTSDAPMNSFWVPALAGQVYAMSGMSTKLHLMADNIGTFNGTTTNISGEGYADMRFKVYSMASDNFNGWVKQSVKSPNMLTSENYDMISGYTSHKPETTYMLMSNNLYSDVIMKYMHAENSQQNANATHQHNEGSDI